jgi:hypothetical protein
MGMGKSKQKFSMWTFVRVAKPTEPERAHFDGNFDGIVCGTYQQLYGGDDTDSYCIYQMRRGRVVDEISWYRERDLTKLPTQSLRKARTLIEEFCAKGLDS